MPKAFVTRKIPENGISILKNAGFEVRVYGEDMPITRERLIEGIKRADALLCLLTDKIDREVIDSSPMLRIISNYAVGLDNIDLEYSTSKRIAVTNTPDVLTNAVAEHTVALMLAVARHIAQSDGFVRAGKFRGWSPTLFLGRELKGRTLGIVGLGRIGGAVASIAACFGMKIAYSSRSREIEFEKKHGAVHFSLNQLLSVSDFVSLHVPLTNETRHLIGEKELALMKGDACLINTSRGPVIEEKALVKALKEKRIGGAALDVFELEPELSNGIAELDNVVLTPHTASATVEARSRMAEMAANAIVDVFAGRVPENIVNREVYG